MIPSDQMLSTWRAEISVTRLMKKSNYLLYVCGMSRNAFNPSFLDATFGRSFCSTLHASKNVMYKKNVLKQMLSLRPIYQQKRRRVATRRIMKYCNSNLTSPVGFLKKGRLASPLPQYLFSSFNNGRQCPNVQDEGNILEVTVNTVGCFMAAPCLGNDDGNFLLNLNEDSVATHREFYIWVNDIYILSKSLEW